MAFQENVREIFKQELNAIRSGGIFKEERIICAPQGSDIEVEFPMGAARKKVINMCANNYLGLSSHPDVVEAARKGLDPRLWHVLRPLYLRHAGHPQGVGKETDRISRHRRHNSIPILHGRQRRCL